MTATHEPPLSPVVVRTYTGKRRAITRQFERESYRLFDQGYRVESQQLIPGKRGGCLLTLGVATLGVLLLLIRPKDTLIVTYRLES